MATGSEQITYEPSAGRFDEAFGAGAEPHPHARAMVDSLRHLGRDRLAAAAERRDSIFVRRGITFDSSGASRR